MKTKIVWLSAVALAMMFGATNLAAKSTAVDGGIYSPNDLEYYMTAEDLLFIRPGLVAEITDVDLPADGQLEVTFSITDPAGLPLDKTGVMTPGEVDFRFTLANYPNGGPHKARVAYERDSRNGTLTTLGDGEYMYKFDFVLDANLDTTHTVVLGFRRDLRDFGLERYAANDGYTWVPSGMSAPMVRDIVTVETCNRCHDPLAMHGGRWATVEACSQCHNPTTTPNASLDTMVHHVHKELGAGYPPAINDCQVCHTGGTPTEDMPLVASPNPIMVCDQSAKGSTTLNWGADIGPFEIHYTSPEGVNKVFTKRGGINAGSVDVNGWVREGAKFSLVEAGSGSLIQKVVVNTTVLGCAGNAPGTPRGVAATQHDKWMTNPNRRACGSCHDYINWETGEGHSPNNWPQANDNLCAICHIPDSGKEFDTSVAGAHQVWWQSAQKPGLLVELLDIVDTGPGENPTVTFKIGDKFGPLDPGTLNRLLFRLNGPNTDFTFNETETVGDGAVALGNGVWSYTFDMAIPSDAAGSYTVSVEGRNDVDINGESERDSIENVMLAFAVTDTAASPRRVIVDDNKCEDCHTTVSLHGNNRQNAQYCTTCHNPTLIDIADVPESVNMKWMIHKIHRGEELDNGYIVIRSRGTYDFSHVEYPGDLQNCNKCHVNDSQQLPLPSSAAAQLTPNFWWTEIEPAAAACLSCHDNDDAVVHAYANTTFFGESCATCHGEGKSVSVDKAHAR